MAGAAGIPAPGDQAVWRILHPFDGLRVAVGERDGRTGGIVVVGGGGSGGVHLVAKPHAPDVFRGGAPLGPLQDLSGSGGVHDVAGGHPGFGHGFAVGLRGNNPRQEQAEESQEEWKRAGQGVWIPVTTRLAGKAEIMGCARKMARRRQGAGAEAHPRSDGPHGALGAAHGRADQRPAPLGEGPRPRGGQRIKTPAAGLAPHQPELTAFGQGAAHGKPWPYYTPKRGRGDTGRAAPPSCGVAR